MPESTNLLTWVHLSDFHIEASKGSIIADQALILDEIAKDIGNYEKRGVPKPELIILTGDIARTGDASAGHSPREYSLASQIISTIQQTLNLDKLACLIVPGNHDVNRNVSDNNTIRLLKLLREGNEPIDDALSNENDSLLLASRISEYVNFVLETAPLSLDKDGRTWWSYTVDKSDIPIRFVGFNTSLLSIADDNGKLQLGNYQFKQLFIDDSMSQDVITIAVSHHPFDWLRDGKDAKAYISKKCDIHLFGHIHDSNFQKLKKGSGHSLTEISSGAAYCNDKGYYAYSYNICSIVKTPKNTIEVRCWPRLWSTKNKEFRDDTENLEDQQKYASHVLRDLVDNNIIEQPHQVNIAKLVEGTTNVPVRIIKDTLDCDPPPFSSIWVGRETELGIIRDPTIKVLAITGIGGQGKSALASKVIEEISLYDNEIYWDWRDCREIGDTFQTHIFRIIERITKGEITAKAFVGEKLVNVINYFFDTISDFKGYFVFDNIDHYIDVETKKPVDAMKLFIDAALSRKHNSKIILTCRPSMQCDSEAFFEISLPGLSIEETHKLFLRRGITIDDHLKKEIYNVQQLTQGHPLWLNLIATQVSKNKTDLGNLILEIKKGKDAGLPFPTLDSIWKTLNDKQKTILKCMAEAVRPESEDRLERYLSNQLNYNQLSRGLRSLKLLNLIVEKKSNTQNELLELHPIIKTYIINQFTRFERKEYINLIIVYLDRTLEKCRKELNKRASFAMLEYWVVRTELAINAALLEEALITIEEVSDELCSSGHSIEFIRICYNIFDNIDFVDAVMNEYKKLDEVFHSFVDALSLHGRYEDAELYLEKYKSAISGKSARYINYCNLMCYMYWCRNDFLKAVYWGQIGSELKQQHNVDTRFDCEHNLALSRRDAGEIDLALVYFLGGESLNEVVDTEIPKKEKGGHFYGNIGRCLWFKNDIDNALICYKKALLILENCGEDCYDNRGWGCYWVAEALEKNNEILKACSLYMRAKQLWDKVSPPKARMAEEKASELLLKYPNKQLENFDELNIEKHFQSWLTS